MPGFERSFSKKLHQNLRIALHSQAHFQCSPHLTSISHVRFPFEIRLGSNPHHPYFHSNMKCLRRKVRVPGFERSFSKKLHQNLRIALHSQAHFQCSPHLTSISHVRFPFEIRLGSNPHHPYFHSNMKCLRRKVRVPGCPCRF